MQDSRARGGDVEAADFDESELDDLQVVRREDGMERERYSLGGASSDEEEEMNGHGNGNGKEKR